jgi:hypothetical protein
MMMGERQVDQGALFYEFSFEKQVPTDHMLRSIDRFVDLGAVRSHLAPFYSTTGRPSVDPELADPDADHRLLLRPCPIALLPVHPSQLTLLPGWRAVHGSANLMAMPLPLEAFRMINGLGAGDRLVPACEVKLITD